MYAIYFLGHQIEDLSQTYTAQGFPFLPKKKGSRDLPTQRQLIGNPWIVTLIPLFIFG